MMWRSACATSTPSWTSVPNDQLHALLSDLAEYMETRQDVRDGSYGIPQPNAEMNFLARIEAEIARLEPK